MIHISIIIFAATLIAIIVMMVKQYSKLSASGELDKDFSSKDLSYENFVTLNKKLATLWLIFIHTTAIVLTKLWARLTHFISSIFHKGVNHVERQIIKREKARSQDGEGVPQSVFLTTIKTYKNEIKKLKRKAEEELPRPRTMQGPKPLVDNRADINTIDETKLPT